MTRRDGKSGGLTRDQVILALRAAAEQRGRGLPLRLVSRAARMLDVSPTIIREWIRKDPKVATAKREAEKVWLAEIDAKLEEVKKRMNGRERAILEAVERGELQKQTKINFAALDALFKEQSQKWRTLHD